MKTVLIISGIIVFIIVLVIMVIKHISDEDAEMSEKLSARDYWRYKNGGGD